MFLESFYLLEPTISHMRANRLARNETKAYVAY